MAKITDKGIEIERLDDIFAHFEVGFKEIYGQDIDLTPESVDGQFLAILSQMKVDIQELILNIYRQVDPDLATGSWLEQRVAYAGLERKQSSHSYLKAVVLTGTAGAFIPKGTIVEDVNKNRWVLITDTVLGSEGSKKADFKSEEVGAFALPSNSGLEIVTNTNGFLSAITTEPAEQGVNEETDEQLRQRFYLSRARSATASAEAIQGKLLSIPDVKRAVVLENYTNVTDDKGVQPHSINAIVSGGDDLAIAKVLYDNKAVGVGIQGQTEVAMMIDGIRRLIRFDRPQPVDVVVKMVLIRSNQELNIETDSIKSALVNTLFDIGTTVQLSRLYTPINSIGGFWVKSLQIGRNSSSLSDKNIEIQPREQARILSSNIEIEVQD